MPKSEAPDPKKFAEDYIKMFESHANWEDYDETGKRIDHAKLAAIKLVNEVLSVLGAIAHRSGDINVFILFYLKVKEHLSHEDN